MLLFCPANQANQRLPNAPEQSQISLASLQDRDLDYYDPEFARNRKNSATGLRVRVKALIAQAGGGLPPAGLIDRDMYRPLCECRSLSLMRQRLTVVI